MILLLNVCPGLFGLSERCLEVLADDGFSLAEQALTLWDKGRPQYQRAVRTEAKLVQRLHKPTTNPERIQAAEQAYQDWLASPEARLATEHTPLDVFQELCRLPDDPDPIPLAWRVHPQILDVMFRLGGCDMGDVSHDAPLVLGPEPCGAQAQIAAVKVSLRQPFFIQAHEGVESIQPHGHRRVCKADVERAQAL